jgi:SAM-dependent methyltransferase
MSYTKSARYYDLLYSWKDYDAEARRLHELIQEHNPGAKTLLDVACGTGKHIELLTQHYDVAGIDIAPEFVTLARERNPNAEISQADMIDFELDRTFDAITNLFSAIGYVPDEGALDRTMATMAAHLNPGGVLLVEPWLHPDGYTTDHFGSLFAEDEAMAITRMNIAERKGDLSIMDMHHLVGSKDGIDHFVERHELMLFTHDRYMEAVEKAGLTASHDSEGLMGRGLYVGVKRKS